jgi:hypothetical protein
MLCLLSWVTPRSRLLFWSFYGTRRFITVFTTACHLSLPSARGTHSTPSHRFPTTHSNILPITRRSFAWSHPFRYSYKNSMWIFHLSHACYVPPISSSLMFREAYKLCILHYKIYFLVLYWLQSTVIGSRNQDNFKRYKCFSNWTPHHKGVLGEWRYTSMHSSPWH